MASTSVLQTLRPKLVKFLSYDDIKDYLINYKLLTFNEYQKLEHLQKNATDSELVEKVLDLVMRKGSNHDTIFVRALGQSLEESASPHRGNEELLPLLQKELNLQQSQPAPAFPRLNAQIINGESNLNRRVERERENEFISSQADFNTTKDLNTNARILQNLVL